MHRREALLLFPDLGFFLVFLLLAIAPFHALASIHEYTNEAFFPRSNSFFFHGGSEGLYASEVNLRSPTSDGKSLIRFESITFRRTKESASQHHAMQQKTGLVEAIIVEVQDRDMIGEALELVEHLGNINDFAGKARLFLVLPVALLDATFIVWIFSSLSKILEKLQMRRSMAKLELYRKFTNSLAIFVLLSVAWIGYELYFNAMDPLSELWQRAWIIPAFWNVLSYALLAIICILWAPSQNPTRYAYSEDTGDDFDEEGVSLTGSGAKGIGDMVNRKTMDHVLGMGDDIEEDKRE